MTRDISGTPADPIPQVDEQFSPGYRRTVVVDTEGRVIAAVEGTNTGEVAPEVVGVHLGDIASELKGDARRRAVWHDRLDMARTTGRVGRYVDVLPSAAGEAGDLETTVIPVPDATGAVGSFVIEVVDRGLAAGAEVLLRESEARFRALAEALPHMVWVSDLQTGQEYFSPRWEAFTGRPASSLIGAGYLDLVHPEDVSVMTEITPEQFAAGGSSMTFRLRRADGEYRWMEASATVIRDDHGAIIRIVGGTNDITDRRRREDETREMSALLEASLAVTRLGRYAFYFREQRLDADDRLAEINGVDTSQLMEEQGVEGFLAAMHPDDRDRVAAAIQQSMEFGAPYEEEYRIIRPGSDGPEEAWLAARGEVDNDRDGPWRLVGVVEDITERKRAAALRAVSQRREALGTLIGGFAHDFNNLIAAIAGNAKLGMMDLEAGGDPRTSLGEILRGADVATELVRRMLDYSRDGAARRVPVALPDVVAKALSLIQPTLPQSASVICTVDEHIPDVIGDPTQLLQVIVNLVTNAGQAIDGGPGSIVLEIGVASPPECAAIGLPADHAVRLVVRDDGPGMGASVSAKAFEPFFTTKPEGTGLGLAAVRSVVLAQGGTISLTTAPGEGAAFTVVLPTAEVPADPWVADHSDASGGGKRVMFVDDEHALTRLAERALPLHGLATSAFTDPTAALAAFRAEPDGFSLLVTDQTMPGLTGLQLTEQVRERRPGIPVILSSGYLTADDRSRADELGVDAVLPKPCSIDDVVDTIRRLIAG